MSKLLCNHCKTELTVSNIKGIKDVNVVTGLALVECKNCGSVTETSSSLAFEYKAYEQLQEREKLHSFEELDYLLKELSITDREKVKHYKFKLSKQYPDDDSGDVYYDITVFKDDTEIGNINMEYHSNSWYNVADDEYVVDEGQKIYYTYTMKLDEPLLSIFDLGIEEYLTEEQKEQLRFFKFKHLISINDDEDLDTGSFGDKYHIINMYGFCVGMLAISDYGTTTVDIELNEELNDNTEDGSKHYIECPKCHNKILGNYWLNVKYLAHNNYGDTEEDTYTGECPICRETIETSELELYTNSMEAEETELQQYYKVIGNFGYDSSPFEDCDYSAICASDELSYIRNALDNLNDVLNVKYLYNIYNVQAVQSNRVYDYSSEVITNIFNNTSHADFKIDSIRGCQFRVLDCSVLTDIVEEDMFDTPVISLLLQVIRNNKILGYIGVEQQYPLDEKFTMFEVKKDSNKKLVELCKFYTSMYTSREDTPIMLSKSRTDGFGTPVCKKCGQLFCDCNLRCKVCGQLFCTHRR